MIAMVPDAQLVRLGCIGSHLSSPQTTEPAPRPPSPVHEHAPWLFPARGTLADARRRLADATAAGLLRVTPLAGHYVPGSMRLGGEVGGVDLRRQPLPPALAAALRDALLVHKVLLLRRQPIGHAQHVGLAATFGEPTFGHVFLREEKHLVPGFPEIFQLTRQGVPQEQAAAGVANFVPTVGDAKSAAKAGGGKGILPPSPSPSSRSGSQQRSGWQRRWHTDVTGALNPPYLSILRPGQTAPARGWSTHPELADLHPSGGHPGATHWVNLAAVYESLPPVLKREAAALFCHHDSPSNSGDCAAEHPLVAAHPETGEEVT
jgi:taurine dioxygenase